MYPAWLDAAILQRQHLLMLSCVAPALAAEEVMNLESPWRFHAAFREQVLYAGDIADAGCVTCLGAQPSIPKREEILAMLNKY